MAVKRPGAYVALAVNYADDEAVMDAGEYAELMYVRILAFCGRTPKTEGWVSDKQIRTRLGLELIPEIGPETAPETRAARLAEVGLLQRERDGYRVTSWLKWNRSAEEITRTRVQDRDRKNAPTSTDTGNGTGKQPGKQPGNATGTRTGIQHPETETETETETEVSSNEETRRDDVARICEHLADRIESNGSTRPTITKTWQTSARLLLDKDNRAEAQVHKAIDWCQDDEFWRANVMSMTKFREKYDQLRLQAQREGSNVRQFPAQQQPSRGETYLPTWEDRDAAGPPPDDPDEFREWHRRLHSGPTA